MIRLAQIRLPIDHTDHDLAHAIIERLKITSEDLISFIIFRRSIDARKRHVIYFNYTIDAEIRDEILILRNEKSHLNISHTPDMEYKFVGMASNPPERRPVIVGSGPCGLFTALLLAEMGMCPIILERGKPAHDRIRDVKLFHQDGTLNPQSNIQFGEGGAGTFSDGKLYTQIKDRGNRCRKILNEFVKAGAPEEILYVNKPHIGTDILVEVVTNLRNEIIKLGGDVRFNCHVTNILSDGNTIYGVVVNGKEEISTDTVVMAIGHSARDTFSMLHEKGVSFKPKPFSIGLRIEHPQHLIDTVQYADYAGHTRLGAASYKLAVHCANGRSAYTFCMCPGGSVVGAASEPGGVVTNGMSIYARNLPNANSALLVNVRPDDFESYHPLAGIEFQRQWERQAFKLGGENYFAPVQTVEDFLTRRVTQNLGNVVPSYRPGVEFADINHCLPDFATETLHLALPEFEKRFKGFALPDAVLTGVETRSSSPVRILRGTNFESETIKGLYPAGEGSGYAGGIMSSAVDGINVAEAIMNKFNHKDL